MTKIEEKKSGLISVKEFKNLARVDDLNCISVYIPTRRAGSEDELKKSKTMLKNSIRDAISNLVNYFNVSRNDAENYVRPLTGLLDDSNFWRDQSDCLSVFINSEIAEFYTLPVEAGPALYIADHFYLLPIFSLFNDSGRFYILNLSQNNVKLYECTEYTITELIIDDLVPQSIKDALGHDFHDQSLQFRTGKGGEAGAMFHGQGAGKDDKEIDLEKYFRIIDQGIMKYLGGESIPLILACVDHYFPVYNDISSYPNIRPEVISGNHDESSPLILHELGWGLLKDYFTREREMAAEKIRELAGTGKVMTDIESIIPAAFDGRVKDLYINPDNDHFGLYDKVNRNVIEDNDKNANQVSLFNMAAVESWLRNGRVFISDDENMPLEGTDINALLRY